MRNFKPLPCGDDPRWSKIREALSVLAAVAAEDPDYAKHQNGRGFSKSDSTKGHGLARLRPGTVIRDPSTYQEVLKMATRYRRQASKIARGTFL